MGHFLFGKVLSMEVHVIGIEGRVGIAVVEHSRSFLSDLMANYVAKDSFASVHTVLRQGGR